MNVCVRVRRTGQAGTTACEVPLDATRAHSERGGWRVAHFPTLGMIWMESGRVGDGLPQGERSINPPAVHARMHKHTDTCRHAIIQHLHTRSLQCCFLLWFFFPRTWDDTQPHEHTSAHEWWHCQRLLCSTLFAVSFEGPTLPILPAPPPPIASSHLLMFLDTSEQLTQSFLSFFFLSLFPSLSLFQHECVYSRPCHDNFHPQEEDYPGLIIYLLHLVLLNTQQTGKK